MKQPIYASAWFKPMYIKWLTLIVTIFALIPKVAIGEELAGFSYKEYEKVLSKYVDDKGMVDYKNLSRNRYELDKFINSLAHFDLSIYDKWDDREKIAFWINCYNALTLKAIIDHYPIKPSFFMSLRFPKKSIRQIHGVWDKLRFKVMNKELTLNTIEHDILRREFNEPRIHMALVCASMGCPMLRKEAFKGQTLDQQLDDQARKFVQTPRNFKVDPEKNKLYISPIFKWFGDDFKEVYNSNNSKLKNYDEKERAILNFHLQYLDNSTSHTLTTGKYTVEFLDYDWLLNERSEVYEAQ